MPAWGFSKFIRTPAEATAAERDWVPPYLLGFPLNDTHPTYYGGLDSRLYYGYGRGYGYATFIYRMPNSAKYPLPDKLPWFTSYPDNGEIFVRSGPRSKPPMPPVPDQSVAHFQVEVPAEATVWIEDREMSQKGALADLYLTPAGAREDLRLRHPGPLAGRWTRDRTEANVQRAGWFHSQGPLPDRRTAAHAQGSCSGAVAGSERDIGQG